MKRQLVPPVPDANAGAGAKRCENTGVRDDLLCVNDAVNDVSASESSVSF